MRNKKIRDYSDDIYYGFTRSVCDKCNKIIDAQIIINDNKVYFDKFCKEHGFSKVLVSSDAKWYDYCRNYKRKYSMPLSRDGKVKNGCPYDCGICDRHRQHTGIIMFGITNLCNLKCPICMVNNDENWAMSFEDAKRLIDKAVKNEGTLEILSISGGEPTLNPNIIDIIKYATENGVVRCCMSTNGIRIAQDKEFVKQLSKYNVLVNLQFDGFREKTYKVIRGSGKMKQIKIKALANLKKYHVKTVLIPTIVKGLNDDEIGEIFDLALKERFIESLHIQTLTHTGRGEHFKYDPLSHITVTDVLKNIEKHYKGKINRYDFVPEPNECFLTGVFLTLPNEVPVPIYRFMDMTEYLNKIENNQPLTDSDIIGMTKEIISNLFAVHKRSFWLKNIRYLKPLIKFGIIIANCKLNYKKCGNTKIVNLMEKNMLLVNFHSIMDKYTFDQKRVMECVHQWITDDERIYPFCSYSLFHCNRIRNERDKNITNSTIEALKLKERFKL